MQEEDERRRMHAPLDQGRRTALVRKPLSWCAEWTLKGEGAPRFASGRPSNELAKHGM